jgi:hypothetical protein
LKGGGNGRGGTGQRFACSGGRPGRHAPICKQKTHTRNKQTHTHTNTQTSEEVKAKQRTSRSSFESRAASSAHTHTHTQTHTHTHTHTQTTHTRSRDRSLPQRWRSLRIRQSRWVLTGYSPGTLWGTHRVLTGYSLALSGSSPGTLWVLSGYSLSTQGVLKGYKEGSLRKCRAASWMLRTDSRVLQGYSRGTPRVLHGYSRGTLRACSCRCTISSITASLQRAQRVKRSWHWHHIGLKRAEIDAKPKSERRTN